MGNLFEPLKQYFAGHQFHIHAFVKCCEGKRTISGAIHIFKFTKSVLKNIDTSL